jgi:hypothetical protein
MRHSFVVFGEAVDFLLLHGAVYRFAVFRLTGGGDDGTMADEEEERIPMERMMDYMMRAAENNRGIARLERRVAELEQEHRDDTDPEFQRRLEALRVEARLTRASVEQHDALLAQLVVNK